MNVTQGGDLSPWNKMKSFYFDDSLAENELHYKLNEYFNAHPADDGREEVVIKCKNDVQYNKALDALSKYAEDNIKIYATSYNDIDIIVEKDPRESYRQFDESNLVDERINVDNQEGEK